MMEFAELAKGNMKTWFVSILVILMSALPVNATPLITDVYVEPSFGSVGKYIMVRVDERIVSDDADFGELVLSPEWANFGILATPGMHYLVTGNRIAWTKDAGVPVAHLYVALRGIPTIGLQVLARDSIKARVGWFTGKTSVYIPMVTKK